MRTLIVDDEPLARSRLRRLVETVAGTECIGEAGDGRSAVAACEGRGVDLVLMDIRMPVMDGLEAARDMARLEKPPAVIFVTAYDDHAMAAFDAEAVDYLLKPVRRERLEKALARARRLSEAQLSAIEGYESAPPCLHATIGGAIERIPITEVIYLQADRKYVTVRHAGGETLIDESLKNLEQRHPERFVRIHRSALVARPALRALEKTATGHAVRLEGCDERLEVSRRHLPEIRRLLRNG